MGTPSNWNRYKGAEDIHRSTNSNNLILFALPSAGLFVCQSVCLRNLRGAQEVGRPDTYFTPEVMFQKVSKTKQVILKKMQKMIII